MAVECCRFTNMFANAKITFVVLYVALCCLFTITNAKVGDTCQSPEGISGTCLNIDQCPPLLALLNAKFPIPRATRRYLDNCICKGRIGNANPVVCCVLPVQQVHRNQHLINTETCGMAYVDKIVGGVDAELSEFPWMALLGKRIGKSGKTKFVCGGSLINDLYVLTAAHCIISTLVTVRLGEHNVNTTVDCDKEGVCSPLPQDFSINKTLKHSGFVQTQERIINDIALIRLNRPAILTTDAVQPICLPVAVPMVNLDGRDLTVAGWGRTEGGSGSAILQKVDVPVMAHAQCARVYAALANMTIYPGTQLCAGGGNVGQDSCSGDSGGPLMTVNADAKYVQHGVVSFGTSRCGTPGVPAVYSRVDSYVEWILDNIHE